MRTCIDCDFYEARQDNDNIGDCYGLPPQIAVVDGKAQSFRPIVMADAKPCALIDVERKAE